MAVLLQNRYSQNTQENTCTGVSFLAELQACNVIKKETPVHVFFCAIYEIFKDSFFAERLGAAAFPGGVWGWGSVGVDIYFWMILAAGAWCSFSKGD